MRHLFEMITKLDHGCCSKGPVLADDQFTMFKRVDITLYEEQV